MRTPRPLLVVAAASILGGAAGTGVAVGLRDDGSTTTTTTVHPANAASDGAALSAREIYRSAADSVAYISARAGRRPGQVDRPRAPEDRHRRGEADAAEARGLEQGPDRRRDIRDRQPLRPGGHPDHRRRLGHRTPDQRSR